jgi:MoxR-like ATPase
VTGAADLPDVEALRSRLDGVDYLADRGLATALYLGVTLPQPVLLEGEAGVGKTEAAKALARVLDTPLLRLQCYEGIDAAEALYEWNYPRQLLSIRLAEAASASMDESDLFGPEFLIARPLLQAIDHPGPRPVVLLVDEVDRLGTRRATYPPVVVLTSNRTRDLHDALKRRCLYHWIDYPGRDVVVEIVRRRVPGATAAVAAQAAEAVARLRSLDVQKPPGVAETIDWVSALAALGLDRLDPEATDLTLGSVLKYREDQDLARESGVAWVAGA